MNQKSQMRSLFILLALIPSALGFGAVPLVLASHKLVKGIRTFIDEPLSKQNVQTVTNLLKHLISECSSDEYIILDIPGLRYDDINDSKMDNWPFLTKYLALASTNYGLPFINDALDLSYLKEYIVTNCHAELMNADIEEENSIDYIDSKTKVISMKFNELAEDPSERANQIFQNDEFIRKIIRKLPSPHYTIILTSSSTSEIIPIPQPVIESKPKTYGVFDQLINDEKRKNEVELHNMYRKVDPYWSPPKHSNDVYLRNKKLDKVKFLDYELWMKNEKLIMTILLMGLTICLMKLNKLFSSLTKKEKLP